MTIPSAPFGDVLRRLRLAAGLTQEEFAERAGLSARAVSDLERGLKHRPRKVTVMLLADALTLSPQERAAFEEAAGRTLSYSGVLGETPAPTRTL